MNPIFTLLLLGLLPAIPLFKNYWYYFNSEFLVAHYWPLHSVANAMSSQKNLISAVSGSGSVLNAWPVFYSATFYPIAGFFSSLLTTNFTMRFLAVAAFLLPLFSLYRLLRKLSDSAYLALFISVIYIWSTYPLTVLYNRGAYAEFIATSLAALGFFEILYALLSKKNKEIWICFLNAALAFGIALGMHPITGMLAVPILGTLILYFCFLYNGTLFKLSKTHAKAMLSFTALVLVILSPFIFAFLKFHHVLNISSQSILSMDPESSNHFFVRLFPFPFDKQSILNGTRGPTPYLELQINMALLFLFGGIIAFTKKPKYKIFILPAVLFILTLWMSFSATPYFFLPKIFTNIQFPYRMITYVNFSVLFLLFLAVIESKHTFSLNLKHPKAFAFASLCGGFVVFGFLLKMIHIEAVKAPYSMLPYTSDYSDMPDTFFKNHFFSLEYPVLEESKNPKVALQLKTDLSPEHYGAVNPVIVRISKASWISTNISAFRWNKILVDETIVPTDSLFSRDGHFSFFLKSGAHTISAVQKPDSAWIYLQRFSFLVSLLLLGITFVLNFDLQNIRPLRGIRRRSHF